MNALIKIGNERMNKPSLQNVDYYSLEFLVGFEDGKDGRPDSSSNYEKDSQPYFNYVEGWTIGNFERRVIRE
jgi:hypothetical protein